MPKRRLQAKAKPDDLDFPAPAPLIVPRQERADGQAWDGYVLLMPDGTEHWFPGEEGRERAETWLRTVEMMGVT